MNREKLRVALYASRDCGECRACCVTHEVKDLQKAAGTRCEHLQDAPLRGCGIYKTRPDACMKWACVWRSGSNVLSEEERPDKIGIVVDAKNDDILFVKETQKDGFAKAEEVMTSLAQKRIVVLLDEDSTTGIGFGPPSQLSKYVQFMREMQKTGAQS